MTPAASPAIVERAARLIRPAAVRELLAASAELLDAHPFGDRAMAARERISRIVSRVGVYPPKLNARKRARP